MRTTAHQRYNDMFEWAHLGFRNLLQGHSRAFLQRVQEPFVHGLENGGCNMSSLPIFRYLVENAQAYCWDIWEAIVGYEALAGRSRSGGRSKLMLQWWSADANGMTQKFGQAMFRRPRELRAGLIALQAVLRPWHRYRPTLCRNNNMRARSQ
jgi:hypothetical protein